MNIDTTLIVISAIINVVTTIISQRMYNEIKYNTRELRKYIKKMRATQVRTK